MCRYTDFMNTGLLLFKERFLKLFYHQIFVSLSISMNNLSNITHIDNFVFQ